MKLSMESFVPTAEELAKAKEVLAAANKKQAHSKMQSMVNFVARDESASDAEKKSILNSRGTKRQDYLLQYVAYQVAKGQGRIISKATHSSENLSTKRFYHWNRHKIEKEVGKETADAWIEAGINSRPDQITGLDTPALRQWEIPVDWIEKTNKDSEELTLSGDKQASTED